MSNALLQLTGVTKTFGGIHALSNMVCEVPEGKIVGVIGPNGAGKTTLIHQISGHAKPDSGRIIFDGIDMVPLPMAARAQRGLVRSFQITSILPRFSALENVAIAAQARDGSSFRFLGNAASERDLNDIAMGLLTRFGLGARAHVPAGQMSHGEKRQLEIAIALAAKPKLLLLDEPLAGTSHDESQRLINILQELRKELPIILIEHDMDAVFALADRVSVLVYGRIIACGKPQDIRDNAEVRAAYLGEEAA